MLRLFVSAVVALVLCAGAGLAQDKANKKKNTTVQGTIKKIDAATGTLTVTVKKKGEETDKEFKVGEDTKVRVFTTGEEKPKELTGKDGLKNKEFKEGAKVAVVTDDTGKVIMVRVNPPKAKPKDKSK